MKIWHVKFCFTAFFALLLATACTTLYGQGCPSIDVIVPNGVQNPGEKFSVTAQVKGATGIGNLKYEWTVSAGTIESGQGSNAIVVGGTDAYSGQTINLKVVVMGLSTVCANTAEEAIAIKQRIGCGMPLDEFGAIGANEVKAHVDNIFVRLSNDPASIGLFEMAFGEDETRSARVLRIRRILDAIKFRKYDINQVTFLILNEEGRTSTDIRIAPPGYNVFEMAGRGEIILGRDMKERLPTLFKNK